VTPTYLYSLLKWTVRLTWPLWVPALVILMVLALPFSAEPKLRWTGMTLQLFGFFLTMVGLAGSGHPFGMPGPRMVLVGWWRSRPRRLPKVALMSGMVSSSATLTGHVTVHAVRLGTLEERLEKLEEQAKATDTKLIEMKKELKAVEGKLVSELTEERSKRDAESRLFTQQVRDLAVGTLALDWLGVCYFATGVFLASASLELSNWMGF
jgi:hypothetical protein